MDEVSQKPKIGKVIIILAVVIVFAGGYYILQLWKKADIAENDKTVTVPFPLTYNVADNTSFACESLVSTSIIGSPEEFLTNGIQGDVQKGTDKIAMTIKDAGTLSFLTGASVETGATEGDNFMILRNNDSRLMAVWTSPDVVSTVVLNKMNGLGVWLKGNASFPLYDTPYGGTVYMVCR